ncbi:hypothetical protein BT63DRAFT_476816 [Microthyrium microscopicum]|uniref:DNA polymerase delta subunit 4 n=1 Tax=Microthyrium microscopicum TaxID=703497 RepID=A0A6A6UKE1_9PEZI|nr:hypothetical protein BT63DRAFT_476816 [Microthyrium microscopicum]
MPATRRSTGKAKSSAGQTKLAFSNRVTKTSAIDNAKKNSLKETPSKPASVASPLAAITLSDDEVSEIHPETGDSSLNDIEIGPAPPVNEEDELARSVKDAQIRKFFNEREKGRDSKRVHQESLSVSEKILRDWDISSHYGPCMGISRTKRWKRAHKLGLKPPIEVLAVLIKEQDAANGKIDQSHLDQLVTKVSRASD